MGVPADKPPRWNKSLHTVTEENLRVSPEEFRAIVVWVTHRVLEQAFDLDELTTAEIDIATASDGSDLVH